MSALTVNVVPTDGGEHLVAGPVVHRVLEDGSSTGGRLGLLEGRYPAGWTGPPPHVHREHEETLLCPEWVLITVTPQRYIDYFRDLQDLQPGLDGLLDPADIAALLARYATNPYPPHG